MQDGFRFQASFYILLSHILPMSGSLGMRLHIVCVRVCMCACVCVCVCMHILNVCVLLYYMCSVITQFRDTALIMAVRMDETIVVKELINAGANLNRQNKVRVYVCCVGA